MKINKILFWTKVFVCTLLLLYSNFAFTQTNTISYETPKEYTIKGIEVQGSDYLDKRILIALSGLSVDDKLKIPGEDLSKAIKTLWKQRLFTNIEIDVKKIEGEDIYLLIKVEEKPRISAGPYFKGIKNSDKEEIEKKIDLRKGNIFTDNLQSSTVNIIKKYFIDKGYLDVNVKVNQKADTNSRNGVKVQFEINKGDKIKIESINIEGNKLMSESQIKGKMKETKERIKFDLDEIFKFKKNFAKEPNHPRWYQIPGNLAPTRMYEYLDRFVNLNIFKTSRFIRKDYEEDKKKVVELYQSKGFRDAKIERDTVYRNEEGNIVIDLKISEGKQYYFRNIYFNGNTKYPDSLLSKIIGIKRGDIYSQKSLDEKLFSNPNGGDVSSLYMDDGYLFFNITPVEVSIIGDSVDIELRINEGPQATINEVRIMGNTKTNEKVVRRELYTLPGNKFSRTDLIRSQRQIAALGYFDPQQMDVIPIPNPEKGTVDIEYRLTEKPSDQLQLSAGYGGQNVGFTAQIGVTFTNFSIKNIIDKKAWTPLPSGDGQRLSLSIQSSGKIAQTYAVSFTEPWLGGKKPNSFTVAFNRTRYNRYEGSSTVANQNFALGKRLGSYYATGVTVAFGTRLKWPDDYFTVEAALSYQNYKTENYGFLFAGFDNGTSHNLAASFNISRSSIDNPLYPKHGSSISFTASATLPYSLMFSKIKNQNFDSLTANEKYKWSEYYKFKFSAQWYTTLVQNLVLKLSAKMGFLGYYNPKIGLPLFERFQVGGDGISNQTGLLGRDIVSARGYEQYTPNAGSSASSKFGAGVFNKFTMELRYPISLNPSATIYGLAFFEGSNAWYNIKDYRPYQLYKSAGIGLRVYLPMFGLLGVDYGFPLDKLIYPGTNTLANPKGRPNMVLGQEPE